LFPDYRRSSTGGRVGKTDTRAAIANARRPPSRATPLFSSGTRIALSYGGRSQHCGPEVAMHGGDWTFWLTMTNFALGLIVLLAVLLVVAGVIWELAESRARKARAMRAIDAELSAMLREESLRIAHDSGVTADPGEEAAEEPWDVNVRRG
jgi:hypothetical protein